MPDRSDALDVPGLLSWGHARSSECLAFWGAQSVGKIGLAVRQYRRSLLVWMTSRERETGRLVEIKRLG